MPMSLRLRARRQMDQRTGKAGFVFPMGKQICHLNPRHLWMWLPRCIPWSNQFEVLQFAILLKRFLRTTAMRGPRGELTKDPML